MKIGGKVREQWNEDDWAANREDWSPAEHAAYLAGFSKARVGYPERGSHNAALYELGRREGAKPRPEEKAT